MTLTLTHPDLKSMIDKCQKRLKILKMLDKLIPDEVIILEHETTERLLAVLVKDIKHDEKAI